MPMPCREGPTLEPICPACARPVVADAGVYRVCGMDFHADCYESHSRHAADACPEPASRKMPTAGSRWDTFIAYPVRAVRSPGGARRVRDPDLLVALEVWLDVKDIAMTDAAELRHLRAAFSRVDRNSSILSWAAAEPPAMTDWRRGLVLRAARSDVAAAILQALAPYHELLHRTAPGRAVAELWLPAARVAHIRREVIMQAWVDHTRHIVSRDETELDAWTRYWSLVSGSTGTRDDSSSWQRGVEERASRGSEVAGRVLEAVSERNHALQALDRMTARRTVMRVRVPGID